MMPASFLRGFLDLFGKFPMILTRMTQVAALSRVRLAFQYRHACQGNYFAKVLTRWAVISESMSARSLSTSVRNI